MDKKIYTFFEVLQLSENIVMSTNYIFRESSDSTTTIYHKENILDSIYKISNFMKIEFLRPDVSNLIKKNINNNLFNEKLIFDQLYYIDTILENILSKDLISHILSKNIIESKYAFLTLAFIERCSPKVNAFKPVLMLKLSLAIQRSHPSESYIYMNKAFELDPHLEKKLNINKDYIFDISHEQFYFDNCPVCKSNEGEPYYNAFSYLMANFSAPFSPAKLWIKCKNCQNLYTYSFPKKYINTSDEINTITPEKNNNHIISENTSFLYIWSSILNKIALYTKGQDILEVGIGNGEFIAVALEMGYKIDSIEIERDVCQKISNILDIEINCCDFLKFHTDKKYSIVTMGDVIEHMTDPTSALNKAYNLLNDNGVLWISTPNYESSFSRLTKFTDSMWNEPTHISYFSYNTFSKLLNDCGFEIIEYTVSNRWCGSMELITRKIKKSE